MFNKENKGRIRVEPIHLDHHKLDTNKRKELIFRNLRSQRSKADIFAIDNIWMPRFAKWAEPLEKYLSEEEINELLPELLISCYYENNIYTLPMFYDLGVLFYRQDLIDKLPDAKIWTDRLSKGITWDQVYKLKDNYFSGRPVYVFQAKAYEGLICNYLEIGAGLGAPVFHADKFLLRKDNILKVNSFLTDLVQNKKIVPPEVVNFDEAGSFVFALENDIPLIRAWITNINNINFPVHFNEKVNNLKIAPLPRKEGKNLAMALGGWNLIISKYSRNKTEAASFLKFVISERAQSELFAAGRHLPVLKNIQFESSAGNSNLTKPLSAEWIKYSIRRPSDHNYTRLSDIYSGLLNKALQGQVNADEVYKLARERIK
jgi:multiple sugar transport system substrate-binding protein